MSDVFSSLKRQYVPLSLFQLQRMIDLGRVNPNEPIDMTTLCNTRLVSVDPAKKEFGIHLTDEVSGQSAEKLLLFQSA